MNKDRGWISTYWDTLDQLYWSPQYLGLKSIPQHDWVVNGDSVSIPKGLTNPKGPLYRRTRLREGYWEYLSRQEEPFNYLFNMVFSILPGDVIAVLFDRFTKAGVSHFYKSTGNLWNRYGLWSQYDNTTSPDGFFVAEDAVLAVELKFNAKTSLDQFAKYMMLLTVEEDRIGSKDRLDLVYIFRSEPDATFECYLQTCPGDVGEEMYDRLLDSVKNEAVRLIIHEHEAAYRNVLGRAKVTCIDWKSFAAGLVAYRETLGNDCGDRTLKRLLAGLLVAIEEHPLSDVGTSSN